MSSIFGPIVTAMVTPFNEDGTINYKQAVELMDYLIQNKTTTILLTGTTGESPTLSHDEEYELYRLAVKYFKGKAHLMAGTGSNCTKTAIESTQMAAEIGMDSTLQVVPYYNKPCQAGIFNHFRAIADSTPLPIMIYNIPGRTGINMTPETVKQCSNIKNIVALKEAGGSIDQMKSFRKICPIDFHIYSGDDGLTLQFLKEGASGVVSVASHIAGEQINDMITAFNNNDIRQADKLDKILQPLFNVLFITSNPIPVKAALKMIGFDCGRTRPPLMEINDEQKRQVETTLDAFFEKI
ncbi:MAG: 4-hydroxy-tetrahydrodipicolinate synthase [Candidatus Margulisiibacteriota bacterium]